VEPSASPSGYVKERFVVRRISGRASDQSLRDRVER